MHWGPLKTNAIFHSKEILHSSWFLPRSKISLGFLYSTCFLYNHFN